jgi:hypothetical protein
VVFSSRPAGTPAGFIAERNRPYCCGTAVPQLVWLSEHKLLVFGNAATLLAVSGVALWYGRSQPCPTDSDAAQACRRLRGISAVLYGLALASFVLGAVFAFVRPALG